MKCNYIDKPGKRVFACANRASGFVSYYDKFTENLKNIYILKGGPGTGKSNFLNSFAENAEKFGMNVTYIHCSSDPSSLDGIILPECSIGIFDGTSPHILEPQYPGARDEIINLGMFWNSSLLSSKFSLIKSLSDKKALCYKHAISSLSLAGKYFEENICRVLPYFDGENAIKPLNKIIKKCTVGSKNEYIAQSPGMKGCWRSGIPDGYSVTEISGLYGSQNLFLKSMQNLLDKNRIAYGYSLSPFIEGELDEITVYDCKRIFTTIKCDGYTEKTKGINTSRFIAPMPDNTVKKLSQTKKKAGLHLLDSYAAFERMRVIHFSLESIYSKSMDFIEKEKYQNEFTERFFKS